MNLQVPNTSLQLSELNGLAEAMAKLLKTSQVGNLGYFMAGKSLKKRLMGILQALLGSGNRIGKEAVPTSHTSLPSTRNSQQHVYCGAPVAPQGSPGQGMVHKQWLHV